MPKATANGVEIEWDDRGDAADPAVLLIMGLGGQMTRWSEEFMAALVRHGFRAIRFDNRDVGLSTKFDSAGLPDLTAIGAQLLAGVKPDTAYTLEHMAADAVAVLDAAGVRRAHVVGASMGGMIAQLVATEHADRVLTLTSIMSSTGNPALPRATKEANDVLMSRPQGTDTESLVAHGLKSAKVIGSPGYPADDEVLADRIRADLQRMHYPPGFARQLAAIWANGDRRARLAGVTAPTLVIHGADDPLVPVEGGRDTARSIPGARLIEIPGMGHDLPAALIGRITDAIAEHAREVSVPA
ncbi:alpha/beta fold hydrolase [uncultured Sphingomonas sp.]|uniref:alpha/beta fold hydrolase n=1 Tax=uncultured Sphingomonas sp. TaxID=158754 RepID=UPI0035CB36F4